VVAFEDILNLKDNGEYITTPLLFENIYPVSTEWKSVPAFETMRMVICRIIHRVFVGLPLCMSSLAYFAAPDSHRSAGRDPGWNALNLAASTATLKEIMLLRLIPRYMIS